MQKEVLSGVRPALNPVDSRIFLIPKDETDRCKPTFKSRFFRFQLVQNQLIKIEVRNRKKLQPLCDLSQRFIIAGQDNEAFLSSFKIRIEDLSGKQRKRLWNMIAPIGDVLYGQWIAKFLELNPDMTLTLDEKSGKYDILGRNYDKKNLQETTLISMDTTSKINCLVGIYNTLFPDRKECIGHKKYELASDVALAAKFKFYTLPLA